MAEQDFTHPRAQRRGFDARAGLLPYLRGLGPRAQALGFLLALLAAEALTTLLEPRLGMLLHGLLFILLLAAASLAARGLYQKFLFALALAPLIRLLSLTMPLMDFPFVFWYMIVGAPLFLAVYSLSRLARLRRDHLGLRLRLPGWQLLVALTGIGFGLLEYVILRPEPLIERLSWGEVWLPALILLVFTGFLEELIFRGVLQYTALRRFGRFGLWYVAAVFAVLHLGYRSVLDVLFVFVVALFFGWVVLKTGSILGVTLSHGLTNVALYLVIPFLFAAPAAPAPAPQEILAPLPPVPSAVHRTPFQPLPAATGTALPAETETPVVAPSATATPTLLPPTETAPASDEPEPMPQVPVYQVTPLPPLPTPIPSEPPPTPTATPPPTADPVPPNPLPGITSTGPAPSATSTQPPTATRTPEYTPTIVDDPLVTTEIPSFPIPTTGTP